MPRRARLALAGVPLHLIQRGNNRQPCFFGDDDARFYLHWLGHYAVETGCALHAYVLMDNHVHLLLTPKTEDSAAQLMKALGQRYVQYVNRAYGRTGSLWEGRFRSCIAGEEAYVLGCQRYIEMNPVRAGMVARPADYRWSSYKANARGEAAAVPLSPHALFRALGRDDDERRQAYRELFRQEFDPELLDEIRQATNGNFALGSERFHRKAAAALGRRVTRGHAGRPPVVSEPGSGALFD
jgi:putative transposase